MLSYTVRLQPLLLFSTIFLIFFLFFKFVDLNNCKLYFKTNVVNVGNDGVY